MGKLKDAHVFSNEEGSIAKFFIALATYLAGMLTAGIITFLIEKEPFPWGTSLLTALIIAAFVTVIYFIARFIAYRTRLFPKTENREGIHGVSFIFLLIITFVLFSVFI